MKCGRFILVWLNHFLFPKKKNKYIRSNLFMTNLLMKWVRLILVWIQLILIWIQQNNFLRSKNKYIRYQTYLIKYFIVQLINHIPTIFDSLSISLCLYYLGRTPTPILTRKVKDEYIQQVKKEEKASKLKKKGEKRKNRK